MHPRSVSLLATVLFAACVACAGRDGQPAGAAELPGGLATALPAPPAGRTASAGELLSRAGGSFEAGMVQLRVANEHNEAVFSPALELPGAPRGVAACVYSFMLGDYAGPAELRLDWGSPGPAIGSHYVGLARPAQQRWEWFAAPADGVLALGSFAAYRYGDGSLLAAVAFVGPGQGRLYGLRIGPAPDPPGSLPLETIVMPAGFSIDVYAWPVPSARGMCLSENGVLYVGSRGAGSVYACRDLDGDRRAEDIRTVATGLAEPVGVDMLDGDLYVSAISRVVRLDAIDANLAAPPLPVNALTGLPTEQHHGWKFIRFGPDGKLYVPVGAPCNICDAADYASPEHGAIPYASLLRFSPAGTGMEVVARGVRNTVGFDWQPGTEELWFTDNGRDNMGDDMPPCELNRIPAGSGNGPGAPHYGYPYFHGSSIEDPDFGAGHGSGDYLEPAQDLGPHVAPLGMRFYRGSMFPAQYRGQAFIAEHGSWNRSEPLGARVTLVPVSDGAAQGYSVFAEGWQDANGDRWGRPVDVLELPDGSLLVSDDQAGAVYRITYQD